MSKFRRVGFAAVASLAVAPVAAYADMPQVTLVGPQVIRVNLPVASPAANTQTQDIQDVRNQGVAERARPGYDPEGVRLGSFILYPTLQESMKYSDNVYATKDDKKGDFSVVSNPQVALLSNWSRHSLKIQGGWTNYTYFKETALNRNDFSLNAAGQLDITRDANLTLRGGVAQLHEEPGASGAPTDASEANKYTLVTAGAGYNQRFNRVTSALTGDFQSYTYDNVSSFSGDKILESDRNYDQYNVDWRVGYDVSPNVNVYLKPGYNWVNYTNQPGSEASRSSDGYTIAAGVQFAVSQLIIGDVYGGYQRQSYDAYKNLSLPYYGANVTWYATSLTTVRFGAGSAINQTNVADAQGYLAQTVGLGIDHELLRNVILSADGAYESDDYKSSPRTDDYWRGGLQVNYLIDRNFAVGIGYTIIDRNSTINNLDYTSNKIGLLLRAQL
ncbi:MAG: outer membrane beta-barrel protein [Parvibaculaceae bacterium]|nr:outer membrane beta-barrel protein [Parvibaculaceae bacterium]